MWCLRLANWVVEKLIHIEHWIQRISRGQVFPIQAKGEKHGKKNTRRSISLVHHGKEYQPFHWTITKVLQHKEIILFITWRHNIQVGRFDKIVQEHHKKRPMKKTEKLQNNKLYLFHVDVTRAKHITSDKYSWPCNVIIIQHLILIEKQQHR